jgi:small-conductance mechanosensitive channel
VAPISVLSQLNAWMASYAWRLEAALLLVVLDIIIVFLASVWRRISWRLPRFNRSYGPSRINLGYLALVAFHLLVAVAVLAVLGVPTTFLLSLLSAGLALGIFSDTYNGTRFLIGQPYRVGDLIEVPEDRLKGYVSRIAFGSTTLLRTDGSEAIVPVKRLSDRVIINHSNYDHVFGYDLDIDPATDLGDVQQRIEVALASLDGRIDSSKSRVGLARVERGLVRFKIRLASSSRNEDMMSDLLIRCLLDDLRAAGVGVLALGRENDVSPEP